MTGQKERPSASAQRKRKGGKMQDQTLRYLHAKKLPFLKKSDHALAELLNFGLAFLFAQDFCQENSCFFPLLVGCRGEDAVTFWSLTFLNFRQTRDVNAKEGVLKKK